MIPLQRYLQDAIAAEKSFETQLKGFADEVNDSAVRAMFLQHASETTQQYEALTRRLESMGGSPSATKSVMAHIFNTSPKIAQVGYSVHERTTQDLMMAYSVEKAEVAMYEAMIVAAKAAGDTDTAALAAKIQQQEADTSEKVWRQIAPSAVQAFHATRTETQEDGGKILLRYLQDAEAAEQNFEDALASFSKSGDQPEVQRLMKMMSEKARTQHQRLESRITSLGGSRSVAKSILAHLLAFMPVSAQLGHAESEKSAQHLMITYAAAAAEMAMYESLAATAEAAGDSITARLARELQGEEKEDFELAWGRLRESSEEASLVAAHHQ